MSARHAILGLIVAVGFADGAAAQTPTSLNPLHALDKASFGSFVEMPLFDPARRLPPPPPPAPEIVAVPPPPPEAPAPVLQLVGIIRGHRDLAIVHRNGADKTVILRNGEVFDGWTVVLKPRGLTLRNGERNVDYAIFARGPGSAAPASAAPPSDPEGQPQIRRHPDQ